MKWDSWNWVYLSAVLINIEGLLLCIVTKGLGG